MSAPRANPTDRQASEAPADTYYVEDEAIAEAFETAFHMTGVAQYLEYYECS